MAYDAFLKLDGIDGESTDVQHKGEIDIMSFSWGESQPGNRGAAAGGGGAGKVSMQDFHFSMSMNKASPQLFQSCASGKHIPSAMLTLRKAGGESGLEFLKIKLSDVLVSSFQTGSNPLDNGQYSPLGSRADAPTDQFTLSFGKINWTFTSQLPTGEPGTSSSFDASS